MTKCDHLSAEDVAKSALVVYNDLISLKKLLNPAQFESTANLRPKRGHKKKATTSLEDKVESESSSSSDSSDNEDSEVEGEIKIQELIQNGYKLPSGIGKLRSDSMTKSESSKVNSSEEIVDDEGIVHPPPGLQETYEDEDEFIQKTKSNSKSSSFSSSTLTSSSQSSTKTRSPLVITDDGEIIGGFDIDYNNLSSKNYSLLMRSAQQQLAKMKVIRDQEIKEKGSVDYQLEEIPDDELDLHSEDDEDMETDSNQASKEADEDGDLENGNIDDDVTLNEIMNYVLPVSATSGAGIQEMWEDIRRCVIANVVHPPGWEEKDQLSVERKKELTRVVREHRLGNLERRRISEGHDGVVRGSHRS